MMKLLTRGALHQKLTAIIVLILLLLVLLVTIIVARSMIIPLRRLRTDALDVAGHRLPAMVQRLSESQEAVEAFRGDGPSGDQQQVIRGGSVAEYGAVEERLLLS